MSFTLYLIMMLFAGLTGYMLGVSDGKEEGYIDGRAEMYDEVVSAYTTKTAIYKEKR